jgi:hypothetical protein
MIGFKLSNQVVNCPRTWQKFIRSIQESEWEDVPVSIIKSELATYNARYGFSAASNTYQVEFETEEELILFILRWS